MAGQKTVTKLKSKICSKYEAKLANRRSCSRRWIAGADLIRTSNIRDHARSDQHAHAMLLLWKEQANAKGIIKWITAFSVCCVLNSIVKLHVICVRLPLDLYILYGQTKLLNDRSKLTLISHMSNQVLTLTLISSSALFPRTTKHVCTKVTHFCCFLQAR